MDWYQLTIEKVSQELKTSPEKGLTDTESRERIRQHGHNRIEQVKEASLWQIFFKQFLSPVIYLLVAAAVISFSLGDTAEGIAIIIVIFINAAIGFYMEWQALTSMNALKKLDVVKAKAYRDGILKEIPSEEITIGDLIYLEAGDIVPADARVTDTRQLQVDESALTGESMPVSKIKEVLPAGTILAEQSNMLFKGTIAVKGNGKAFVTGIGAKTELGKISELVKEAQQSATPLEQKLNSLTKKLIWLTIFLAAVFFISGWIRGNNLLVMLETAIAMSVAAIPEGLPIVATIALARGMVRMSRKNVLVKRLSSVETLGSANVILTDKTGTLTENKITPTVVVFDDKKYQASEMSFNENSSGKMERVFQVAILCNDASIDESGKEIGDPLEISLIKWAEKNRFPSKEIQNKFPRIDEEPFNSDTKYMGTLHQHQNKYLVFAKGALEELLKKCSSQATGNETKEITEEQRKNWHSQGEQLAEQGIRVLAFAYRESDSHPGDDFIKDLTFVALVGFIDPPQQHVPQAIDECKNAGVKVAMITGDHPATALFIAKQVHLASDGERAVNGKDIADLPAMTEDQKKMVLQSSVFARVTPKQKLDIVTLYQENGYIAAMTGDGVNDAPALKKADIGIAMGVRGTQIAKETADLILKDDSFISIVSAVKHGRIIFENIRKCIIFLLSCNLSEILIISAASFLVSSSPLSPLQILYINLITDVFPALALGMSKGNPHIMKQPPRDPKEGIVAKRDWKAIVTYSVIITISIFSTFVYCREYLEMDVASCNNVVFIGLALAQLWHVFNLPSAKVSFFNNEVTSNKYIWFGILACLLIMLATYFIEPVREVLAVTELSGQMLLIILVASILPVVMIQLLKRLRLVL